MESISHLVLIGTIYICIIINITHITFFCIGCHEGEGSNQKWRIQIKIAWLTKCFAEQEEVNH